MDGSRFYQLLISVYLMTLDSLQSFHMTIWLMEDIWLIEHLLEGLQLFTAVGKEIALLLRLLWRTVGTRRGLFHR